jgi:hypothetical protein
MTQEIKKHSIVATIETFSYVTLEPKTMKEKTIYYLQIQMEDEEPLSLNVGEKTHNHIKKLATK